MNTELQRLKPQSQTLLIPLFARARARKWLPSFRDELAEELVKKFALAEPPSRRAMLSAPLRSKAIDECVLKFFHGEGICLSLGAGLCSRPYRLKRPGIEWVEVDLPEVQKLKSSLFPEDSSIVRISADLRNLNWLDDLPRTTEQVLIVMEGILHYLEAIEVRSLLRRLIDIYPQARFVFDTYAPWVIPFAAVKVNRKRIKLRWGLENKYLKPWGFWLLREKSLIDDLALYSRLYRMLSIFPSFRQAYRLVEIEGLP